MNQEDKELLLKDLCARLPYGVKADCVSEYVKIKYIDPHRSTAYISNLGKTKWESIEVITPYLRPMESMDEEEDNEWNGLNIDPLLEAVKERHTRIEDLMLRAKSQYKPIDWLNAHHFDYRGLIERGLALEAPEGMYNED